MCPVFQEHGTVAHIYLGSQRYVMRPILNGEDEPFWHSAKQVEVGVISPRPSLYSTASNTPR
jgi:hypothetical protein